MENEKKYEEGCSKACPCQSGKFQKDAEGIISRVVFSTGESYTISEIEPDIYRYTYKDNRDKSYQRDRRAEGEEAREVLSDSNRKPGVDSEGL